MSASGVALIRSLYQEDTAAGARQAASPKRKGRTRSASKHAGGQKATLGTQFRLQLGQLIKTLRATNSHFIRCVKSNTFKKPSTFQGALVLRQLRYGGLFEVIRIRHAGYSFRLPFFEASFTTMTASVPPCVRVRSLDRFSRSPSLFCCGNRSDMPLSSFFFLSLFLVCPSSSGGTGAAGRTAASASPPCAAWTSAASGKPATPCSRTCSAKSRARSRPSCRAPCRSASR